MNYISYCGNYSKEKVKLHKHNEGYEIYIYASGKGKLNIEGKTYDAEQGMIVVMPPNIPHGSLSLGNLTYLAILAKTDELMHLDTPIIFKDNESGDGFALLQMIFSNRFGVQDFFNSLCSAFIRYVLKNIKFSNPLERAVNNIKKQITKNLHDNNFNVTEILNKSGYAEDYIRAHFKKIIGKTPIEFLTELRIKNAVSLIKIYQRSMSLMEIATLCGFDDYIYFSRKFKSVMGISPQCYKNSLISGNN